MSANIHGQMVYSFEKPMWHNITAPSLEPMSAIRVLNERFGGGFEIFLRSIQVELNKEMVETGDFAIIRGVTPFDAQEIVLDYCSERYRPLQPREVAQSFDSNVREPAETMAFLGNGSDMFISWKMPSFSVRVGDDVEMYGIVRTGFDTMNGTRLFTSVYRPVCANTISLAENWAKGNTDKKGKGEIWKGKGTNKNLLRDLGYWMAHVQESAIREGTMLQSLFGRLAETPIKSENQAVSLLTTAYPNRNFNNGYYPKELVAEKEESVNAFNEGQEEIRNGILNLFNGAGTEITPDYWGMLNATSEFFCHVQPSKKPIAESVLFGNRQKKIMQMVEVLTN